MTLEADADPASEMARQCRARKNWRGIFMPALKPLLMGGCALAIFLLAASGEAQTYTFTTLAGNAAASGGSTDGTNANGLFFGPAAVAVDSLGNLYVADQYNDTIRKVTPVGTNWVVSTLAGEVFTSTSSPHPIDNGTNSQALFNTPTGIAVDSAGNLYVADQGDNAIRKITPAGTNWVTTTIAGAGNSVAGSANGANSIARFNGPTGIAVDAFTNLYVADQYNNTIRKITPAGTNWNVTTIAGTAGVSGAADGVNNAASFRSPTGVAVDAGGRIFVADQVNNIIRLMTPSGTNWVVTTIAGQGYDFPGSDDGTNTAAEFLYPTGVAVDQNDNVYVTDEYNSTIRKMTPLAGTTNWVVTTIGGQAQNPGAMDGMGTNALFYYPFGLTVDPAANLYVADTDNNTIRKGFLPSTTLTFLQPFGVANGRFNSFLSGPSGRTVVVQASTNLFNWQPIWTNTLSGTAPSSFSDPQTGVFPHRFYRAVLE